MQGNTLGSKLRAFRRRKAWTQKHLAQRSGLSSSYIGLLELDDRRPEREKLAQLCKALALSPQEADDLFLTAGYSPLTEETMQALHTLLQTGAVSTGKQPIEPPVTPEVLKPLGPYPTNDGKFTITIWRELQANRSFLLIQDTTAAGAAEGQKVTLVSNSPDRQLVAQGYITDRHLALSVNYEIKLPLNWTIKTETHHTSKGKVP